MKRGARDGVKNIFNCQYVHVFENVIFLLNAFAIYKTMNFL